MKAQLDLLLAKCRWASRAISLDVHLTRPPIAMMSRGPPTVHLRLLDGHLPGKGVSCSLIPGDDTDRVDGVVKGNSGLTL